MAVSEFENFLVHKKYDRHHRRFLGELEDRLTEASKKYTRAAAKYPPSKRTSEMLDALVTAKAVCGNLPLSNLGVRKAASAAMIETLLSVHQQNRKSPVRTYLFTATFDDGIVPETAPDIPLYRIERKVRSALLACGLQAICFFEIDILKRKLAGEDARLLLVHVHGVCWTKDVAFRAGTAARKLNGQRRFRNRLGVPAIKFVTRKQMHARRNVRLPQHLRKPMPKPHRDQTAASMARMAAYITKEPCYVKNRYLTKNDWWAVRYDEKSFNLKTRLRMAEIWSRITPFDAGFAVGTEAAAAMRGYCSRVRVWAANQARPEHVSAQDIDRAWQHLASEQPKLGIVQRKILRRAPG